MEFKSKGLDTMGAHGGDEVDVPTGAGMQRNRGELSLPSVCSPQVLCNALSTLGGNRLV